MHNLDKEERGFTLLELLVASTMLLFIGALAATTVVFVKRAYTLDMTRKQVNQSLRGALDILSADIRVGGENLPGAFPAFTLINGGAGPDELVVRRNVLDEVLKVCQAISSGSAQSYAYFAIDDVTPGCVYADNTNNFNAWRDYRIANGGSVPAYIINMTTGIGEFFTYANESNASHKYQIIRSGGTWSNAYNTTSSAIYLLEEWRYRVNAGVLQVIAGNDTQNPFNVMLDTVNFKVVAVMSDDTTVTALPSAQYSWTDIKYFQVDVTTREHSSGGDVSRTLRSRYFPRNVLSY